MLMKLLPNINDVSALLIQQGRQFNFGIDDSKMVAKVTDGDRGRGKGYNGGQNSKGVGKSTKACTYCNKTWHTVDYYYRKYGFPPNFKQEKCCELCRRGRSQ